MKFSKKQLGPALLASAAAIALIGPANAGEREDALIAKVTAAYGGKKLQNLRSIRITDSVKNIGFGQGWSSEYIELAPLEQDVQIDLRTKRMHGEFYGNSPAGGFHNVALATEDGVTAINYLAGTFGPGAAPDFYAAAGATVRTSDTLLAYELQSRADSAQYLGTENFFGLPHEKISFDYPGSPPLLLYVDSQTGFIRKMTRETQFGALTYQFPEQITINGLAYAPGFDFYVGPDAISISSSREVSFNGVRDSVFDLDPSLSPAPEAIDTTEMSVAEIADGLHLVGSGIGYSLFAATDDGVVGVGGYGGLEDRYNAYLEAAGHQKPLTHQIVTHHHTDHLAGMTEAFNLGATFISPAGAVTNLRDNVADEIPDGRLQTVKDTASAGPFKIYVVTTSHVEEMALAYHPASKTLFQVDHYNTTQVDGFAPGNIGTASLKSAIDDLGIEVDVVLSGHGPVSVRWADFMRIASEVSTDPCPSRREICN